MSDTQHNLLCATFLKLSDIHELHQLCCPNENTAPVDVCKHLQVNDYMREMLRDVKSYRDFHAPEFAINRSHRSEFKTAVENGLSVVDTIARAQRKIWNLVAIQGYLVIPTQIEQLTEVSQALMHIINNDQEHLRETNPYRFPLFGAKNPALA